MLTRMQYDILLASARSLHGAGVVRAGLLTVQTVQTVQTVLGAIDTRKIHEKR
jgi:hypothetical protein